MALQFYKFGVCFVSTYIAIIALAPRTNAYGNAFEHFIILECIKLSHYYRKDYRFSYLRTAGDIEIDLVVERPGKPLLCIEIKSTNDVKPEIIASFRHLTAEIPDCEAIVLSQDKYAKKIDRVLVLPWQQGLKELLTNSKID